MSIDFKNTIRELREKHFPGRSIRSLQKELQSDLGEHFYTYISKLEAGLLPSTDFLKKIEKAYSLTQSEYQDLCNAYLRDRIEGEAQRINMEPAQSLLFRKIKKKQ